MSLETKEHHLQVQIVPEYAEISWEDVLTCMVEVKGLHVVSRHTTDVPPNQTVYVVDCSGSMSGARIALVERALRYIAQSTPAQDFVALVTFNDMAHVVLPMTQMTPEGRESLLQCAHLVAEHSTNIFAGLYQGSLQFNRQLPGVKNMVLLTDGEITVGYSHVSDFLQHIQWQDLQFFAMGVGSETEVCHTLLTELTERLHTRYYRVPGTDQLLTALGDCFASLLSTVAQNVQVEITCTSRQPDITSRLIYSRSTHDTSGEAQNSLLFELGNLFEGSKRSLLLECPVSLVSTIRAEVRYVHVYTSMPCTLVSTFSVEPQVNPRYERNKQVAAQMLRVDVADILNRSPTVAILRDVIRRIHQEQLEQDTEVGLPLLHDLNRLIERIQTDSMGFQLSDDDQDVQTQDLANELRMQERAVTDLSRYNYINVPDIRRSTSQGLHIFQ